MFLFSCCRSIWQREKTFLLRNILFKERLESGFKRMAKGRRDEGCGRVKDGGASLSATSPDKLVHPADVWTPLRQQPCEPAHSFPHTCGVPIQGDAICPGNLALRSPPTMMVPAATRSGRQAEQVAVRCPRWTRALPWLHRKGH